MMMTFEKYVCLPLYILLNNCWCQTKVICMCDEWSLTHHHTKLYLFQKIDKELCSIHPSWCPPVPNQLYLNGISVIIYDDDVWKSMIVCLCIFCFVTLTWNTTQINNVHGDQEISRKGPFQPDNNMVLPILYINGLRVTQSLKVIQCNIFY